MVVAHCVSHVALCCRRVLGRLLHSTALRIEAVTFVLIRTFVVSGRQAYPREAVSQVLGLQLHDHGVCLRARRVPRLLLLTGLDLQDGLFLGPHPACHLGPEDFRLVHELLKELSFRAIVLHGIDKPIVAKMRHVEFISDDLVLSPVLLSVLFRWRLVAHGPPFELFLLVLLEP